MITIDAMGCQKHIAQTIIEKEADYLLAVKDNQPTLKAAIQETLDHRHFKPYAPPVIDVFETSEKSRDRMEIRRCWSTQSLSKLSMSSSWTKLTSIGMVETERYQNGKCSIDRRYYIASKALTAQEMLTASRSHWSIENSLHWVLDMAFREDESRVRVGNAAENLSRLRQFSLNLLKQDKTDKAGIKNKRLRAGWDNDYLLHLLGLI